MNLNLKYLTFVRVLGVLCMLRRGPLLSLAARNSFGRKVILSSYHAPISRTAIRCKRYSWWKGMSSKISLFLKLRLLTCIATCQTGSKNEWTLTSCELYFIFKNASFNNHLSIHLMILILILNLVNPFSALLIRSLPL